MTDSRRSFFSTLFWGLGALLGAFFFGVAAIALLSPALRGRRLTGQLVALGSVDDYMEGVPTARRIQLSTEDAGSPEKEVRRLYVLRTGAEAVVLSPVCTHLGCQVEWESLDSRFHCPCHGGRFDVAGRAVSGPPRRPLQEIPVHLDGGRIFVRLV